MPQGTNAEGEMWDCALPGILEIFQITDGFRESGFPGTRDPACHQNDGCCVTWGRSDQLCKDLRRNVLHGKVSEKVSCFRQVPVTAIFDIEAL